MRKSYKEKKVDNDRKRPGPGIRKYMKKMLTQEREVQEESRQRRGWPKALKRRGELPSWKRPETPGSATQWVCC